MFEPRYPTSLLVSVGRYPESMPPAAQQAHPTAPRIRLGGSIETDETLELLSFRSTITYRRSNGQAVVFSSANLLARSAWAVRLRSLVADRGRTTDQANPSFSIRQMVR